MTGGAVFRERREAMEKSVDDVAAELRIGHRFILGIEEENFSEWPERVFSVGFIRAYAKYLGTDPSPVIEKYTASLGAAGGKNLDLSVRSEWIVRDRRIGSRRLRYLKWAGVVFLAGILLLVLSNIAKIPQVPVESNPASLVPPLDNLPLATGVDNVLAVDNLLATDNILRTLSENTIRSVIPPPVPPLKPVQGPSVSAVTPVSAAVSLRRLVLVADDNVWVRYAIDNGARMEASLRKGERKVIEGRERVSVLFGNAGGVTATVNGKQLEPFGKRGEVKNVEIPLGP